MAFRIVIDVRRIRDFGIGTYIRNLVRSLSEIDHRNEYTLITGADECPELGPLPSNFQTSSYKRVDGKPLTFLSYPIYLRSLPADIFHIPLNAVPFWMPRPYVVTIHDMASIRFGKPGGFRNNLRLQQLRQGLLNASQVIAVSNATRRDVETFLGIPPSRVRTIYNAPDPMFSEPSSPAISCIGEETFRYPPAMQRILDRYQIHYPFLLYAGRTNPHKNLPRLVEAFAVLRGELAEHPLYKDLRLIIIGDDISRRSALRHAVIQSRVEQSVRFLGFVPIETLRVFYQAAAAFVFPSLYEGFGLPPLEAMACGTPVITSAVSSLPEVVGDAAAIVNPENVFDIARGIRETLLDLVVRGALISKGFEQLKKFSWAETASCVLQTYEEVAAGKSSA
ncbi:MAG: glycosyltransferase family 4 protein [Bryobacteraceae bacterium]